MKNIYLLLLLAFLIFYAYQKEKESDLSIIKTPIIGIIGQDYELVLKDENWLLEDKIIDQSFILTYLGLLKSINILSQAEPTKSFGMIRIKQENKMLEFKIGKKAFAANGFYMGVDNQWFLVKSDFSKGIIYKDENDLAQIQYDMIYNLINFSKKEIKLK